MVARNPPPLPNVVYCTASNRIIDLVRKAETEADAISRLPPFPIPNKWKSEDRWLNLRVSHLLC